MIYLLGVDHQVQHQKDIQISKNFLFYLTKKVKELNITVIGEEWSSELLEENGVTTTTPQDVARELNIAHIFCNPNSEEMKILGIPNREAIKNKLGIKGLVFLNSYEDKQIIAEQRKYFPIKERFWLNKIKNRLRENIIFVCGTDHLKSFGKLLSDSGCKFQILPKRFDIVPYLRSQNKDL